MSEKDDVPMFEGARVVDTRRVSRQAASFAFEEYLRQCSLTALLFSSMTIGPDGEFVLYDMLDEDDCHLLDLEKGEGPLELWIAFKPTGEES